MRACLDNIVTYGIPIDFDHAISDSVNDIEDGSAREFRTPRIRRKS